MFVAGAVCCLGVLLADGGAAAVAPPIRVQGTTVCPTPSDVDSALAGLLEPAGGSTAPDVVELTADGSSVNVRLVTAGGERMADRRLPEGSSCAERARAAAVIVAAWEVRLRGGAQPMLPAPGPRATEPISRPSFAPPTAQPISAPAPPLVAAAPLDAAAPLSATVTNPPAVTRALAPDVKPRAPLQWEIGGEVLTSLARDVAKGGLIEVRLSRPAAVFAAAVSGLAVDAHTTSVGSGEGSWRRFGGILDLRSITTRWRAVELEVRLGLALTALSIRGQAFPVTRTATLFDPGGVVGFRARLRLARLRLGSVVAWADASAVAWPRAHNLYVEAATTSADVPAFEALLGVGVSLPLNR